MVRPIITTDEQANELLAALSSFYGVPVMPISRYCEALRTWQRSLDERVNRIRAELYPGIDGDSKDPATVEAYDQFKKEQKPEDFFATARAENRQITEREYQRMDLAQYMSISDSVGDVFLQIGKSNLLARLLYVGEKLRTQMCPEHKGKWSGVEFSDTRCPHGCQLTGWIQEPGDKGTPLPGVQAIRLVPTGNEGEVTVIKDVTGEILGQAKMVVPAPVEKSPIFCEHANEVPQACPCPPDCYCKDPTCKGRPS